MARYPSTYPNAQNKTGVSIVFSVQRNRKASLDGNSFASRYIHLAQNTDSLPFS